MDLTDSLRLEVGDVGSNLVLNPNGEKGAWFYRTPVNTTAIYSFLSGLAFETDAAQACYWTTIAMPIAAGQYASSRFDITYLSASHNVKVRYEWLDANQNLLSSSSQGAAVSTTGTAFFGPTAQAPASTAYFRMRWDFYNGAGNPSSGSVVGFTNVMATASATGTPSTNRVNLCTNPSFETNTSSWQTTLGALAVSNTFAFVGTNSLRITKQSGPGVMYVQNTDAAMVSVTAGKDYTVSANVRAGSTLRNWQVNLFWYKADGTHISDKYGTQYTETSGAWKTISNTGTAPTGAAKLRVDIRCTYSSMPTGEIHYLDAVLVEQASSVGTYFDGATTDTAQITYDWSGTANASTSTANSTATYFDYSDPYTWLNILGPTSDISTDRGGLDVGTLTATIYDSTLDPSVSNTLGPSKLVRLRALVSGTWTSIYEGRTDNLSVNYRRDESVTSHVVIKTDITLTAVDNIQQLANSKTQDSLGRSIGVALGDLPAILEGAGVPWNVNGYNGQVLSSTTLSTSDDASVLDQVSVARDSANGFAWVDKTNVLNAVDSAHYPSTVVATFSDTSYPSFGDCDVTWNNAEIINRITVNYLQLGADGSTTAVPFGPYVDSASETKYGTFAAEFTYQAANTSGIATFAQNILTARSQPVRRAHNLTYYVRQDSDIPLAASLDLYQLVHVNYGSGIVNADYRVTSISHRIVADKGKHRWAVLIGFDTPSGIATPRVNTETVTTASLAGEVTMWASSSLPAGWMLCDGSAVSRTTYADLFAAIGTTWGAGDGSTTFNLPNMVGRMPLGAGTDTDGTNRALGTGGGSTHISTAQLPSHAHDINVRYSSDVVTTGGGMRIMAVGGVGNTGAGTQGTGTTGNTGSGSAYYQPYRAINYIIRYA